MAQRGPGLPGLRGGGLEILGAFVDRSQQELLAETLELL